MKEYDSECKINQIIRQSIKLSAKNSRYRTIFMIIYLIRTFCEINFVSATEDYLTAPADFPQQKHGMICMPF